MKFLEFYLVLFQKDAFICCYLSLMAPLGDTKCIVTVTSEYGQFDGKGWVDDVNNELLLESNS